LALEACIFIAVPKIRNNFRWNDKLIFAPQWKRDEDLFDRIGLKDKIIKDIEKMQDEYEMQERLKEIEKENLPIPGKKNEGR